jgi:hypothetical protein
MLIPTDVTIESLYEITEKDSHKSLYIAVILQALLDVSKPKTKEEENEIKLQRDQARAWFFTSAGVTCEDFEIVCQYAGLEPKKVRNFAYEVIQSGDVESVRRKFSSLIY